jgi:hypothetical protein
MTTAHIIEHIISHRMEQMTLTLHISPQLESRLRTEAAKQGLEAGEYALNTLQEHLNQTRDEAKPCLTETESDLLQQINIGLSEDTWQRYRELIDKRRAETLTPDGQVALIQISDELEQLNAKRVQHLVELAKLRNVSLSTLMQQLGIETP